MKRLLAAAITVALAASAIASPAVAGDKNKGNAYGKVIRAQCTAYYGQESMQDSPYYGKKMTYGQLWRIVRQDPEARQLHAGSKPSAKRFVTSGALDTHCPAVAPAMAKVGTRLKGKGWGLLIRVQCTASMQERTNYGQLWRQLKRARRQDPDGEAAMLHQGTRPSAKRFATRKVMHEGEMQTLLDIHCPVLPVTDA